MTELEPITVEAELGSEDAAREIAKAVSFRHSIARKHIMGIRRRHPEATPAEVIAMLERHYTTAITMAGALIAAGAIAAEVGIAAIPGGSVAKKGSQEAAKIVAKRVGRNVALGVAKVGANRAATLIPAGDQQMQFELTAMFGLAIADIHGQDLDRDQAQALVYGLSNARLSQQQIATMAKDVSNASTGDAVGGSPPTGTDKDAGSHWASMLAATMPGEAAKSLVRTMETGELDTVRESLSSKQRATVDYGIGAVTGGVTRFAFGRQVVIAARTAFPAPPEGFPARLAVVPRVEAEAEAEGDDGIGEENRAFVAMEEAAKALLHRLADTASAVGAGVATGTATLGTGVASAANSANSAFRSVDLDGDGIPDEARALTKAKDAGRAISSTAGVLGGRLAGRFASKQRAGGASGPPATDGKGAGGEDVLGE